MHEFAMSGILPVAQMHVGFLFAGVCLCEIIVDLLIEPFDHKRISNHRWQLVQTSCHKTVDLNEIHSIITLKQPLGVQENRTEYNIHNCCLINTIHVLIVIII